MQRGRRRADDAGVRLGLEPVHASQRELYSFLTSVPETLAFLEEVGRPSVGVMFDTYHLWDTPTVLEDVGATPRGSPASTSPTPRAIPGRTDRVLPGDGGADLPRRLGAFERAGWDGFHDVEIFSDADRLLGLAPWAKRPAARMRPSRVYNWRTCSRSAPGTGTVTFLFTDIEGSTRLARVLFARGELELAGTLWGSVKDEVVHDRAPAVSARQPAFTSACERGRTVDLWDAVAIALEGEPQTEP